jgi:hypothetical protein
MYIPNERTPNIAPLAMLYTSKAFELKNNHINCLEPVYPILSS